MGMVLIDWRSIGLVACLASLVVGDAAQAADATYPDLRGAWLRPDGAQWDFTKPPGLRQQAPLTPEYQRIFEANLADQKAGNQSYNSQARCYPSGMPRVMVAYYPLEFIVTPEATYVRSDHLNESRRIHTDGRSWPASIRPTFEGYSIGSWIDQDGDGHYDVLAVETRGMRGPRQFDASGLPLHADNQTVLKERIYVDRTEKNLLHNEITVIDHALTRPWTVMRNYRRMAKPVWVQDACGESNNYVILGRESYFLSGEGLLMPTRKDQPPPDLRYFTQASK